jgi:hypothetical protein
LLYRIVYEPPSPFRPRTRPGARPGSQAPGESPAATRARIVNPRPGRLRRMARRTATSWSLFSRRRSLITHPDFPVRRRRESARDGTENLAFRPCAWAATGQTPPNSLYLPVEQGIRGAPSAETGSRMTAPTTIQSDNRAQVLSFRPKWPGVAAFRVLSGCSPPGAPNRDAAAWRERGHMAAASQRAETEVLKRGCWLMALERTSAESEHPALLVPGER